MKPKKSRIRTKDALEIDSYVMLSLKRAKKFFFKKTDYSYFGAK